MVTEATTLSRRNRVKSRPHPSEIPANVFQVALSHEVFRINILVHVFHHLACYMSRHYQSPFYHLNNIWRAQSISSNKSAKVKLKHDKFLRNSQHGYGAELSCRVLSLQQSIAAAVHVFWIPHPVCATA
jgi:hypothetical protein